MSSTRQWWALCWRASEKEGVCCITLHLPRVVFPTFWVAEKKLYIFKVFFLTTNMMRYSVLQTWQQMTVILCKSQSKSQYDLVHSTLPMIRIVSHYSDSATTDTLHHLTEEYKMPPKREVLELCIYSLHCGVSFTEFDMNWDEMMYSALSLTNLSMSMCAIISM